MSKRICFKSAEKREQRRQDGDFRNAEWRKLLPFQQWNMLDLRLGRNKGAKKQRTKLAKVLNKNYPE